MDGISCSNRRCACNPYPLAVPSGSHGAADEPVTAFAKGAASFSSDAGELQCRGLQYIGVPSRAALLSLDFIPC